MNRQTAIIDSIRSALATPIPDKLGEVFESNPLLESAAAFFTTRIALRSLTGLFAVGIIAGGLLYLRENHAAKMKHTRKAARKAKKKAIRQLRNMPEAQEA